MPTLSTPGTQRRWKALPGEPVGDAGDVYTGYDRFGRTERMRWGKLGDGGSFNPLVDVSWGYSPSSQKTWKRDLLAPASSAQDQKFGYDGLYQVTQRQRGALNTNLTAAGGVPAQQENFSYDETGNWRSYRQQNGGTLSVDETRVNNQSNQITQVDGSSAGISYDGNGNMLEVPTGDALTDPSNRVVWDGWNRPVKVYAEDTLIAEYRYDGLGRRITVASAGVTRHTYYDDQWRSIEERIDDTATAERQHVWHPADRWEMILRDRSTTNNGVMDERLYPMKDQLDPVALSDDTGVVVERFDYTAFGIPSFLNADFTPKDGNVSSYLWELLFHAEFEDSDTGWFNYGYRYYSPSLGRWLSRDPIGERGGLNLYGMAENNLSSQADAWGLVSVDFKKADENPGTTQVPDSEMKNPGSPAETSYDGSATCQCSECCGLSCSAWISASVNENTDTRYPYRHRYATMKDFSQVYGHEQAHIRARNEEVQTKLNKAVADIPSQYDKAEDCEKNRAKAEKALNDIINKLKNNTLSPSHRGDRPKPGQDPVWMGGKHPQPSEGQPMPATASHG